ncbi:hypothetical protein HK096_008096, partial [Nowakowskiella sp. JEL0078]
VTSDLGCIINEYNLGQGIKSHVDSLDTFGPVVASLSLLTPCSMSFCHVDEKSGSNIKLPPRSLIVLTEEARYKYKHGISKDEIDYANGEQIIRGRRVSLTFRTLISE